MSWELLIKGGGLYFVVLDHLLIALLGWVLLGRLFGKPVTGLWRARLASFLDMGIALFPFLGLAGTVWEISGALQSMGGGVTGLALAGPLGSALRFTFHGIIAASLCLVVGTLLQGVARKEADQ